jgi:Zn-dependent protease with chaperone function
MTAPAVLTVFAVVLALFGPALLSRASWLERSPRIGIAAWQALSVSLVSAVLLAGLSLAVPAIPWTTDLAELIRTCAMTILAQYSTPGGAVVSATGAAAALVILARVAYCIVADRTLAARNRKAQLDALALIARPHLRYDALVVEHTAAAAYCLPGRARQVVLTSATLSALDHSQLLAVLAHERAHLRGRHDLILAAADSLQRAFPRIAAFRTARTELGRLVEMLADDNAARQSDRTTVATALVRLAEHGMTPVTALGAGGESALSRVRRLISPVRPLGAGRTTLAALALGMLVAVPVFVAIAPASAAAPMPPCPVSERALTM